MKNDDLIVNRTYTLKHTGQFCHCAGAKGYVTFSKRGNDEDRIRAKFIGIVNTGMGPRAIFLNNKSSKRKYISFAVAEIDFIES